MCMASYFPAGIMPDETHLFNGAEVNPDGHGYAIVTKDRRIMVYKSMDAEQCIERFIKDRAANPEGPALFHSRIATSGLVDITGCHPFKVGRDNRTVVAHNGVLFQPSGKSRMSDTAIFASSMLPQFGNLDKPRKQRNLARYIGDGNKLVILTVNPNRRETSYLINEDAGQWVDGAWHSNSGYLGPYWKRSTKWDSDWEDEGWWEKSPHPSGKGTVWNWKPHTFGADAGEPVKSAGESARVFQRENLCFMCKQSAIDPVANVCEVCGCCQDCLEDVRDCMCYYPGGGQQQLAIAAKPATVTTLGPTS